ncbi:hypothetical protein CSC94_19965 [Zhengella mangrovi]|uniref:VCBS repeat-containing protein n=1 Tax=Zhengella mangrovi TaxID=1982044 RepID=A0A2G1QI44_9HYPH|nr:VCBS repeat-containing protein [Zhengella mangrovi]PHP65192.1 hypothetical protein CSC94_19965 [Zhengella mangrovi]
MRTLGPGYGNFPLKAWSLFLVLVASIAAHAQPVVYGPQENYSGFTALPGIGSSPAGVDIGVLLPFDFNHDGREDMLLTQFYNPLLDQPLPVIVYLNTPAGWVDGTAGVFAGAIPQLVSANGWIVDDFNGDGMDDVWLTVYGYDAGNAPGDQNQLYLSRPDGRFDDVSATHLPQLDDTTHSAASGDINGDGFADIFVGNIFGANTIGPYFLINDGTGRFTRDDSMIPQEVRTLNRRYTSSLISDLNFDGNNDLVLGFHAGPDYAHRIWYGNGDGTFNETVLGTLPAGYSASPYLTSGDLNRDGNPDLLFSVTSAGYQNAGIQVFLGRADGSFVEHDYAASPYVDHDPYGNTAWVYEMHPVLLNAGDCTPDITARLLGSPLYLQNAGTMTYSQRTEMVGTSQHVQVYDNDGDGGTDLFYLNPFETSAGRARLQTTTPGCGVTLLSSVSPGSRSVQTGQSATLFANMMNTSGTDATGCHPAFGAPVAGSFFYQSTDPATNQLTGTPNTPVDIPAGGIRTFLIGFTASEQMSARELRFGFLCDNSAASAPVTRGVNTASIGISDTPTADIIAIASTPVAPGVISTNGTEGNSFFASAGINIGTGETLVIEPRLTVPGPAVLGICETNSAGACIAGLQSSLTAPFSTDQTRTFAVHISANGQTIPADYARNRIRLEFREITSGALRGATSVAVTTQQLAQP